MGLACRTIAPLLQVVAKAAEACPIIRAARDAAVAAEAANHGHIPPVPGTGWLQAENLSSAVAYPVVGKPPA